MANGIFYLAFVGCLLAFVEAQLSLPNLGGSGNVNIGGSGGLGGGIGVTGGLTGSGGIGSPISSIESLVNSPLVQNLASTINLNAITNTAATAVQSALNQNFNIAANLKNAGTVAANPNLLSFINLFKPQVDALNSLRSQVTLSLANPSARKAFNTCFVSLTGITNLNKITLAAGSVFNEVIKCALPAPLQVFNKAHKLVQVKGGTALAPELLSTATKCLQQSDIGSKIPCAIDPVIQAAGIASNLSAQAKSVITDTLSSIIEIPSCAQKPVVDRLNEANNVLEWLAKCSADAGFNLNLPNLPTVVLPNFSGIANKSLEAIENIYESALGSNGPVNNLFVTLNKVKNAAAALNTTVINNSINTAVQGFQQVINLARSAAGGNTAAIACVASAQKALNDIAPVAFKNIVTCSFNIGKNAASLAAQVAAFDIGLKTDLLKVLVSAVQKCVASSLLPSVDKCFDAAISESQNYVKMQIDKINKAQSTAQEIIDEFGKCLSTGINLVNKGGQEAVARLKDCLGGQGITISTEISTGNVSPPTTNTNTSVTTNVTTSGNTAAINAAITSGKAAVERVASQLKSSINVVSNVSINVQTSIEFISSLNINSAAKGSIDSAKAAVLQIEQALKDDNNVEVKNCINAVNNGLNQLDASASSSINNCVSSNKEKVTTLAAEISAADVALKEKVANAGVKAEQECSLSTEAEVQKCFVDVRTNLNTDVNQTIQQVQRSAQSVQQSVNDAVKCVNDVGANTVPKVNNELSAFSTCLGAQGYTVTFSTQS